MNKKEILKQKIKKDIKELKNKLGFTNIELADYIDCPEMTVKNWSCGRAKPSLKYAMFIDLLLYDKPIFIVADKLNELKKIKGFTDVALAEFLDCGTQTVRQYMGGSFFPDYDKYLNIRRVLELEGLV